MQAARLGHALALALAVASIAQAGEEPLPQVTEGGLVYRSPISGRFDFVALKHTTVDIDVRGLVASATVSQSYQNETGQPIEAVYVFPLPHDAAVYDLEARIGARVIRAVVKEREEAKKTYQAAKADGKRAALLEQERPNVFTASVANVMPGDRVDVTIRYVQPLAWEDGRVRLTFPMVVGPRYIPGSVATGSQGTGWAPDTEAVPDASQITPQVRHPESRPHDVALLVRLDLGLSLASVTSPSHEIRTTARGAATEVELAGGETLPNRDFVLEAARDRGESPKAALFLSPRPGGGEAQFMLVAYPPSPDALGPRPPLEMVFLIDVSGSMHGPSIEQARQALLQGLDRLRRGDRFAIVGYDDKVYPFRPTALPATAANLEAARRFVHGLQAGGGTELLPALELVLGMPRSPAHLRDIVLLTDGCLGNEEQVFAALRARLGEARLFTVAIGSAPNHFFATRMAQFGRGSFTAVTEGSEVLARMGRLLDQIESPVLTGLKLSFEGLDTGDVFPARLPDLFRNQPLVVYGRLPGSARGSLRLEGDAGGAPYRQDIPLPEDASFHAGITTLWARQKVEEGMDRWRSAIGESDRAARRAEVVAHAIRYNLVTAFTSLIAVEDVVVNKDGAPVTSTVPTELPAGWSHQAVFGVNPATGTADEFLRWLAAALLLTGAGLLRASRARWGRA